MKFEDKLAQLAFGELSPEEAQRIEAQAMADPHSRRMLETYRSMKSNLRDLSAVPEDQMSKERLRDAILGQGLRPERAKSSGLGWLWMPATAAVLAAGLMLFRNRPAEPTVALSPTSLEQPRVELTPPSGMSDLTASVIGKAFTPGGIEIQDKPVATASRSVRGHRSIFRDSAKPETQPSAAKLQYTRLEDGPKIDMVVTNESPAQGTNSIDDPVALEQSSTTTTPIVMIEDNRDTQTGALKATEVGASNVLIGG